MATMETDYTEAEVGFTEWQQIWKFFVIQLSIFNHWQITGTIFQNSADVRWMGLKKI